MAGASTTAVTCSMMDAAMSQLNRGFFFPSLLSNSGKSLSINYFMNQIVVAWESLFNSEAAARRRTLDEVSFLWLFFFKRWLYW